MPSWKISVLSQAARAGQPPADVAVVRGRAREADQLAVEVDGLEDEDVLQVHAAVEGVVHHEHVAGPDPVAVLREQRAPSRPGPSRGGTARSPPARPSRPWRRRATAEKSIPSRTTVECAVRKIVVAISSAIDASALPTICSVTGSTRAPQSPSPAPGRASPVARVAPDRPARAGRRRRVVLVDEQRAGLGRVADRRRASAPATSARVAVDLAAVRRRSTPARRSLRAWNERAVDGARRPSAARRSARISIGEPGLVRDAVEPLVLVLERARSARRGRARPAGKLDLDLPALAAVAELGRAQPTRPRHARRAPARAAPPARRRAPSSSAGDRRRRASRWHASHVVELRPREEQAERR